MSNSTIKTIDDINLHTWFVERELNFLPEHFILVKIPVEPEAREWIIEKLQGRYTIVSTFPDFYPAFEDPKEAVLYQLSWSN